jgi:hypothetical protein
MESEINGENSGRDDKGRFGAGNPGKPKGAASNASAKVKAAVIDFLERNTENIQESFDKLKPADKLRFISDILPYATPKLSSIQSENETNVTGGITISWQDPPIPNTPDKGSAGEL